MERVRYSGPDPVRWVAMPGGTIECQRMKWVDLEARAAEAGIGAHHIPIIQAGLLIQEDWEPEGLAKAARTRRKNAAETPEPVDVVDTDPAVPDEEQS